MIVYLISWTGTNQLHPLICPKRWTLNLESCLNCIRPRSDWTSETSESLFAEGQLMVPICSFSRHTSVQFYWKIDFSFPATGTAAGNLALISGMTSVVSLKKKLLIAKLCASIQANANAALLNAPEKCMQMLLCEGLWHRGTFVAQ